jgi:hypothetical protein
VISFGLETLRKVLSEDATTLFAFAQLTDLVGVIASQALRLGFLIRGGATIGKLYHARGVVFGEALVEATQLEARTAVYPRLILSPAAAARLQKPKHPFLKLEDDGIFCADYMHPMLHKSAVPGNEWAANVKRWFVEVIPIVQAALETHARSGRLNELAKWTWFARRFRAMMQALPPPALTALGVSGDDIPWGK